MAQPPPGKRSKSSKNPESLSDSSISSLVEPDDPFIINCWHAVNEARREYSPTDDQNMSQEQLWKMHQTLYSFWEKTHDYEELPGYSEATSGSEEMEIDDQQQAITSAQKLNIVTKLSQELEKLRASSAEQSGVTETISLVGPEEAACPIIEQPLKELIEPFVILIQLIGFSKTKLIEIEGSSTSAVVAGTSAEPTTTELVATKPYKAGLLRKFRHVLRMEAKALKRKFQPEETDKNTMTGTRMQRQPVSDESLSYDLKKLYPLMEESEPYDVTLGTMPGMSVDARTSGSVPRASTFPPIRDPIRDRGNISEPVFQRESSVTSPGKPQQSSLDRQDSSDTLYGIPSLRTDTPKREVAEPLLSPKSPVSEKESLL